MEIGKKIKLLREEHHLTQDQLSQKMGITRQALSNYEREVNTPDIQTCINVADIFNISLDEFLLDRKSAEVLKPDEKTHFSSFFIDLAKAIILMASVVIGEAGVEYAYSHLFSDAVTFLLIRRYISLILIPFLLFLLGNVLAKLLISRGIIKGSRNPHYYVNPWIILALVFCWFVIIHVHLLLRVTQTEPAIFKQIMETVTDHDFMVKSLLFAAGIIFRLFLY